MVVNGRTFRTTHPKRDKLPVITGKKDRQVQDAVVLQISGETWFREKGRSKERYSLIYDVPAEILNTAVTKLAVAHKHRIDLINGDDLITVFKSMKPQVVGMPQKSTKKFGMTEVPIVLVKFFYENQPTVIRIDEMRDMARRLI